MNSKDFQENALKTESIPAALNVSLESAICALDIAIAAGDVVDAIKKAIFYKKPIDNDKFIHQLRELSEMSIQMRLKAYSKEIVLPISIPVSAESVKDLRVLHGALGMFTESAEMLKAVRDYAMSKITSGEEFDVVNFCEEMGDSDWYKAILHDSLGVSEEQIRAVVIAKLKKRYGDKFSAAKAIDRDLTGEREILEKGIPT